MQAKLDALGGVAGLIGGAAFMASGLLAFVGSDTFIRWFGSDSFLDLSVLYQRVGSLEFPLQSIAVALGLVLMLCVLAVLPARQPGGSGTLGKIGLYVSLVGSVLLLFGILMASLSSAIVAGWIPVFSWEWYVAVLAFIVGLPVVVLGLVVSITATLWARVLPRWARYGFAGFIVSAFAAFVVDFLLGIADDVVENSYIEGDRSRESYTELSRTLDMLGDALGLVEGVLFGLAWVVIGLALLRREGKSPAEP